MNFYRLSNFLCLALNLNIVWASYVPFKVTRLLPRRFGQQNPSFANAGDVPNCPGEVCGTLFGKIPTTLLAAADPCDAQDLADTLVDAAKNDKRLKPETAKGLIEVAKKLCAAEHNTPPDFQKNPPEARNALYCLKKPKNPEIDGIFPKQDPANPPDKFFDPKTKKTVLLGQDPRTRPRNGSSNQGSEEKPKKEDEKVTTNNKGGNDDDMDEEIQDPKEKKDFTNKNVLNLEINAELKYDKTDKPNKNEEKEKEEKKKEEEKKDKKDDNENNKKEGFQGIFIDPEKLKACSNPKIIFQSGYNGRQKKDLTFHPADRTNYPQAEALNLEIVTKAMCDKMLNCGFKNEDEIIKKCRDLSQKIGQSKQDGTGADNWNAAFGIITNFSVVKVPEDGKKK